MHENIACCINYNFYYVFILINKLTMSKKDYKLTMELKFSISVESYDEKIDKITSLRKSA